MSNTPLIMVVDDDAMNRELMETILMAFNFRPLVVNRGEKAILLAREKQPDLVLADINMPGINGYELCRRLKTDESTKHIPVALISGVTDSPEERKRAREAGASALILRGIDTTRLIEKITSLLPDD